MNLSDVREFTGPNKTCVVFCTDGTRCKRPTHGMWETMKHGIFVPVCKFHYLRKLWWYKGAIYDHTEEL
jgi:hypothetical protein